MQCQQLVYFLNTLKKKVGQGNFAISLLSILGNSQGPSFEKTWIPITQICFVVSLIEIGPVISENRIFIVCHCIFGISLLSPLKKGQGPSIEQAWHPITQGCFEPSFIEIGPVVLEKKTKMRKVYKNDDDDNDATTDKCDEKISLEWAKKKLLQKSTHFIVNGLITSLI